MSDSEASAEGVPASGGAAFEDREEDDASADDPDAGRTGESFGGPSGVPWEGAVLRVVTFDAARDGGRVRERSSAPRPTVSPAAKAASRRSRAASRADAYMSWKGPR